MKRIINFPNVTAVAFLRQLSRAIALLAFLLTGSQGIANPAYSHVVVVVEENHGYSDIIGNSSIAPYINDTLASGGIVLTNAYGEQHPSQPNYYWLFSGGNQGISNDTPPLGATNSSPNLYTELQSQFAGTAQANNFFGAYVDQFPGTGGYTNSPGTGTNTAYAVYSTNQTNPASDTNISPNYAARHVPWLGFSNINGGNPSGITVDFTNSPLSLGNFSNLPVVSFIIPGLNNDMHDWDTNGNAVSNPTNSAIAIQNGDAWLSNNLSSYAAWAKSNNSLLIVTWDEDHSADWATNASQLNPSGLTAPDLGYQASSNTSGSNQIAMVFYGANLATNGLVGTFGANSNGVNNLNLYDTLQSFYGISNYGTQSDVAAAAGLVSAPITDIFAVPEPGTVALFGISLLLFIPFFRTLQRRGS